MISQKITRGLLWTTASVALVSTLSVNAQAADAPKEMAAQLEEIIVTARMREESLQSVPVAVNAFSARQIEDAGIYRPGDFIALSPNVSITESQDPGTSFLTIRGISQVRNSEPSVALIIDGVAQASPQVITQDLFDIAEIQVLKGPQGALYGRNSIGGAIIINTKQPTDEFEGWIRAGAGNGQLLKAQAALSGPIIKDELFFRVAASGIKSDGYLDNVYLDKKADPYNDQTVRGQLKWMSSENVTVSLQGGITHTTAGAFNFVINSNPPFTTGPDDADNTSVPITAAFIGESTRNIQDVALKVDVDTGYGTLSSVSAYTHDYTRSAGPGAPYDSAASGGSQDFHLSNDNYSQELRFTSPSEERVRYILGAYYLHTDREIQITNSIVNTSGVLIPGIHTSGPNQTTFAVWDGEKRDAYAGFAQLAFDITPELELDGAIRYDRDHRKQTNILPVTPTPGVGGYTYPDNPNFGSQRTTTHESWQPKVSLAYKPTDDFTAYASFAKGFASGGFNPNIPDIGSYVLGAEVLYSNETTYTYEGGIKTRWLDGRLAFNAAVFRTTAKDMAYFSFFGPPVNNQIITTFNSRIWGFESGAQYIPVDGLNLFAGFGYTDAKVRKYLPDPTVVGNVAPYVPKYTFNAGAQYTTAVTQNADMFGRIEYAVKGKQYWGLDNTTARSAVNLVNARFGFRNDASGWSITAWARNLFDEKYNAEYVNGGFAHQALPRTYGIDLEKKF